MTDPVFTVPLDTLITSGPVDGQRWGWGCNIARDGLVETQCAAWTHVAASRAQAVAAAAAHLAEVHGLGADQPKLSVRFAPDGPDSGDVSISCGNCLTEQTTRIQFNYPDAETNALLAAAFRNIGQATGWWHD